jgi:hypothetical protein
VRDVLPATPQQWAWETAVPFSANMMKRYNFAALACKLCSACPMILRCLLEESEVIWCCGFWLEVGRESKMSRLRCVITSAAIASLTLISAASAATISDELLIFRPSGSLLEDIIALEKAGHEGGRKYESIIAPNTKVGPLVLLEPDGSISDIVGVFKDGTFGFLSDHVNGNPLTSANLAVFAHEPLATSESEIDGFIDVTSFIAPVLQKRGFTAFFASDFEVAAPIPAAFPLFASGLGVMGFVARRRKRKVAAAVAA